MNVSEVAPEAPAPVLVPRIGRVLDLVGLSVFAAGAALVYRAWLGFREVQAFAPTLDDPPMAALQLADRFWRIQKVGIALILVGIAVFVGAWWIARHRLATAGGVEP